jgi:hypothetical protein
MEPPVTAPITIALVNDYDIVVMGIAHILEQYRDRVVIAELDTNQPVSDMVDIALYGSFAQPDSARRQGVLITQGNGRPPRPHTRPSPHRTLARRTLTGVGMVLETSVRQR